MTAARLTRRACLGGLASGAVLASRAAYASNITSADWMGLELLDEEDRRFCLGDLESSRMLIQLWASWCPLCLDELPLLNAAATALGSQDIDVLLVSSPADWARDTHVARKIVPGLRRARPSGRNPPTAMRSTLFSADGWYYVPRSLLYDRRTDAIVWRHLGQVNWRAAPWYVHEGAQPGA